MVIAVKVRFLKAESWPLRHGQNKSMAKTILKQNICPSLHFSEFYYSTNAPFEINITSGRLSLELNVNLQNWVEYFCQTKHSDEKFTILN